MSKATPSRRSSAFYSRRPFHDHDSLTEVDHSIKGPFPFLDPTRAHFQHHPSSKTSSNPQDPPSQQDDDDHHRFFYNWTSRDNRKGRHALTLSPSTDKASSISTPPSTTTPREILRGIIRMFTTYPIWDVSYLVATIFTFGSVVWCINAFFVFLPLLRPGSTFEDEELTGGGVTAFVGATIFEVGSVLLMLEAINEHREGCFGWALEQAWEGEKGAHPRIQKGECSHHHPNKRNLVGKAARPTISSKAKAAASDTSDTSNGDTKATSTAQPQKSWTWYPSMYDVRTHYIHSLGFIACFSQLIGATIFWISGFTALPGILNNMSPGLTDGIYWVPQVLGGCGFIVSGTLFMIETQEKWWKPAFGVLGWHIGFWNLIGGIGFTICPCFGFDSASWAQYQASCSTFWGSWAFLIGSTIQWYESLDKYPVSVKEV